MFRQFKYFLRMGYYELMNGHLLTVVPCVFLGAFLLIVKKGNKLHRITGRVYMSLMMITAIITLFMPALVGPRLLNHFGFIHGFSFLTIYTVPTAIIAIKRGNVKSHQKKMVLLYFGAIIIAGGFTFFPGRYLHSIFFGG